MFFDIPLYNFNCLVIHTISLSFKRLPHTNRKRSADFSPHASTERGEDSCKLERSDAILTRSYDIGVCLKRGFELNGLGCWHQL
jgi:hypothetical protein